MWRPLGPQHKAVAAIDKAAYEKAAGFCQPQRKSGVLNELSTPTPWTVLAVAPDANPLAKVETNVQFSRRDKRGNR